MRKVTCVLQLLDAGFDRQIHNNNNNMRAVKRGLVATMGRLETGVLTVLWNQVLQRFQLCSASLQSADQDLNTACNIYQSLIVFVQKLRATYAAVECTAKQLTNCEEYRQNTQRTRKRNQKYDGSGSPSSSTACLPRFRNAVKPMRGSAPDLAFCAMFGQCRRMKYLCSQQHWLNGFLMTWRPACSANLCNSRRCWTPTSDGKLRACTD